MSLKDNILQRDMITHVALRFQGATYSLPAPNRHHHVIRHICETTGATHVDCGEDDQGFLDASGRYLNRKQALYRGMCTGQVKDRSKIRMNMLFSEDIW